MASRHGGGPLVVSKLEVCADKSVTVADYAIPLSGVVSKVWQAARMIQDFMKKPR